MPFTAIFKVEVRSRVVVVMVIDYNTVVVYNLSHILNLNVIWQSLFIST